MIVIKTRADMISELRALADTMERCAECDDPMGVLMLHRGDAMDLFVAGRESIDHWGCFFKAVAALMLEINLKEGERSAPSVH